MAEANEHPTSTRTERTTHSLGEHRALIETHAAHCRRQLALLAVTTAAVKF